MFRRAKNVLKYRFYEEDGNVQSGDTSSDEKNELINEILQPAVPSSSCWFASLKPFTDNFKNSFDFHSEKQKAFLKGDTDAIMQERVTTAKQCPGIIDYLKNSYLIKSPAEIYITVDKEGNYVYRSSNNLVQISSHDTSQFYSEKNNLFEGKLNLKLRIPVVLSTEGTQWLMQHPIYHSNPDFTVTPGTISDKYTQGEQLNIIVLVDTPKDEPVTYRIGYGDVLAYLWFPHKMELVHDNTINMPLRKRIDTSKAGFK